MHPIRCFCLATSFALCAPVFVGRNIAHAETDPPVEIRTTTVRAEPDPVVESREPIAELGDRRLHQRGPINQIRFSPDGRRLATTGVNDEGGVYLWNPDTGDLIAALESGTKPTNWYNAIAFTPDGQHLLGGTLNGGLDVWQVVSGANQFSDKRHDQRILAIATSADSRIFATVGGDGLLKVSVLEEPDTILWQIPLFEQPADRGDIAGGGGFGGRGSAGCLKFTPDQKSLIVDGGPGETVLVLDAASGEKKHELKNLLSNGTGHNVGVNLAAIHVMPDSRRLIVTGCRMMKWEDVPDDAFMFMKNIQITEAKVWRLGDAEPVQELTRGRWDIGNGVSALSKDGRRLALAHYGRLQVIDTQTGREVCSTPLPGWPGRSIDITADGTLVAAGDDHAIALVDVETGERRFLDRPSHRSAVAAVACTPGFDLDEAAQKQLSNRLVSPETVQAMAVPLTITAGHDGRMLFWNSATGEHVRSHFLGPDVSLVDIVSSPDGRFVAACGSVRHRYGEQFGTVAVWHLDRDQCYTIALAHRPVKVALGESGRVAVAHSPSGHGTMRLEIWEHRSGYQRVAEYPKDLRQGMWYCSSLKFSPDGRYLHIAEHNGDVIRWDTTGVDEDQRFSVDWRPYVAPEMREQRLQIGESAFSPNGERLIVTTNQAVFLWNVKTQLPEAKIEFPEMRNGFQLGLSPDGKQLAVTGRIFSRDTGSNPIWVVDAATLEQIFSLPLNNEHASSLAFTPDSKTMIAGLSRGVSLMWDVDR